MLEHAVNDKSGRGTDGSNGRAAMRPWIPRGYNEARVTPKKTGRNLGHRATARRPSVSVKAEFSPIDLGWSIPAQS